MINLLQQSNLCNNHYNTSKRCYRKTLLLQLAIVVLKLLYRVVAPILCPLRFVHSTISASTHLLQDVIVFPYIVHANHRWGHLVDFALLCLVHASH